jgi:hypothetical protein
MPDIADVKARYPHAVALHYKVPRVVGETSANWVIQESRQLDSATLGQGDSESEAWHDAASNLSL